MNGPLGFIESVEWTFASSMPWLPHWYIVRREVDRQGFDHLARYIRLAGRLGRWGKYLNWYLHLPGHEFYYWTMGWPLRETIIINRARVTDDHVRYLEDGDHRPGDREIIEAWCDFTECPQCLDTDQTITAGWEPLDLLGLETRLVSLRCPSCDWRYL